MIPEKLVDFSILQKVEKSGFIHVVVHNLTHPTDNENCLGKIAA